jgi:hypothetical protein
MSAEDLGTRELGQVRSQRLDEVSFLFLFVHVQSRLLLSITQALFFWFLMGKDGLHCIKPKDQIFVVRTHPTHPQRRYFQNTTITFDPLSDCYLMTIVPGHSPLTTQSVGKFKDRYSCPGQASRQPHYAIRPYKSFCHTRTPYH